MSVEPKYILALVAVLIFAIYLKLSNPYREYGTSAYWQSATIETIQDIPEDAFISGNKNGSLLLWAAGNVSDLKIIAALVDRGGDINEVDGMFMGTPLMSASASNNHPEILKEVVRLGGEISVRGQFDNTALMTAAMRKSNPEIIKTLVELGAKIDDVNELGQTALTLAILAGNTEVIRTLEDMSIREQ